jgi:hypothetical protein
MMVSGVQAAALHKPEHRRIWEGKRVMITKDPLKGYHGLVAGSDMVYLPTVPGSCANLLPQGSTLALPKTLSVACSRCVRSGPTAYQPGYNWIKKKEKKNRVFTKLCTLQITHCVHELFSLHGDKCQGQQLGQTESSQSPKVVQKHK